MPLFLLFLVVPIVEIALFIQVGGWIGLWPTLGIVVATAFAGTVLVRTQGLRALARLQASLAEGRDPIGPIAHGALILVAGILLLTPGFFTDAVGLALLVPAVRQAAIRWGASRLTVMVATRTSRRGAPPGFGPRPTPGETVDADYEVLDEAPRRDVSPRARANGSDWTRPPG